MKTDKPTLLELLAATKLGWDAERETPTPAVVADCCVVLPDPQVRVELVKRGRDALVFAVSIADPKLDAPWEFDLNSLQDLLVMERRLNSRVGDERTAEISRQVRIAWASAILASAGIK